MRFRNVRVGFALFIACSDTLCILRQYVTFQEIYALLITGVLTHSTNAAGESHPSGIHHHY